MIPATCQPPAILPRAPRCVPHERQFIQTSSRQLVRAVVQRWPFLQLLAAERRRQTRMSARVVVSENSLPLSSSFDHVYAALSPRLRVNRFRTCVCQRMIRRVATVGSNDPSALHRVQPGFESVRIRRSRQTADCNCAIDVNPLGRTLRPVGNGGIQILLDVQSHPARSDIGSFENHACPATRVGCRKTSACNTDLRDRRTSGFLRVTGRQPARGHRKLR